MGTGTERQSTLTPEEEVSWNTALNAARALNLPTDSINFILFALYAPGQEDPCISDIPLSILPRDIDRRPFQQALFETHRYRSEDIFPHLTTVEQATEHRTLIFIEEPFVVTQETMAVYIPQRLQTVVPTIPGLLEEHQIKSSTIVNRPYMVYIGSNESIQQVEQAIQKQTADAFDTRLQQAITTHILTEEEGDTLAYLADVGPYYGDEERARWHARDIAYRILAGASEEEVEHAEYWARSYYRNTTDEERMNEVNRELASYLQTVGIEKGTDESDAAFVERVRLSPIPKTHQS